MKDPMLITHTITPPRTILARSLRRTLPADPPIWAMRGILITTLALGCIGAGATVLPGHTNARVAVTSSLVTSRYPIDPAWMY